MNKVSSCWCRKSDVPFVSDATMRGEFALSIKEQRVDDIGRGWSMCGKQIQPSRKFSILGENVPFVSTSTQRFFSPWIEMTLKHEAKTDAELHTHMKVKIELIVAVMEHWNNYQWTLHWSIFKKWRKSLVGAWSLAIQIWLRWVEWMIDDRWTVNGWMIQSSHSIWQVKDGRSDDVSPKSFFLSLDPGAWDHVTLNSNRLQFK